jgi:hypothetical protein
VRRPLRTSGNASGDLRRGKESGEECGADGHGLDKHVLVSGVRAVTDGAEAIERRDAQRRGEVPVRASTGRGFAQGEAQLLGEGSRASEENGALLAFERRAIKTAMDFELGAAMDGFQSMQALFEGAHIGRTPGTQIELGFSQFRDDVDACSALDDIRIYSDAMAEIVPLFDAGDLRGELMNGVDAFFRGEAGMRGAAMNNDFGLADALAGSLDEPARTERWLEDKDGVAAASFRFDEDAGGFAADLLVGSPQENDALGNRGLRLLQGLESKKRLNNAGLHVKGAGAIGFATREAIGHFGDGAGGVDRIVVAEDEELRSGRSNGGRPDDAKMIAAMLLAEHLDERAAQQPFVREKATAAVGAFFIQAGRFQERELLEDFQHVRQPAAEQGKKSLWK